MVIRPVPPGVAGRFVSVKIRPERTGETLAFIEEKWKEHSGGRPFDYSFLSDDLNILYKVEEKTGQLFALFSLLAVLIASLGLFGLASFTAERRTKEIGIRKVLGSSASGVLVLLNKEYMKLVVLSNIIAWPVAYFLMRNWLQNFAFRTNLSIGLFLLSAIMVLAIALLSVSFNSWKAAISNPIDSLRYE